MPSGQQTRTGLRDMRFFEVLFIKSVRFHAGCSESDRIVASPRNVAKGRSLMLYWSKLNDLGPLLLQIIRLQLLCVFVS